MATRASAGSIVADQFDRASEREDLDRELAIKEALRPSSPNRLMVTGKCHNCDEPLNNGGLFCDRDCSADHEHRARARRF